MNDHYLEDVKILIVDDNAIMRKLVKNFLAVFGATHFCEAADGSDALTAMEGFRPNLVITDHIMHTMDGIEFTKRVRADRGGDDPDIPIIMMSGLSDPDTVKEARNVGINAFLAKPFTAQTLISRIDGLIDNPQDFIRTESYRGPDRRWSAEWAAYTAAARTYDGEERRGQSARVAATTHQDRDHGAVPRDEGTSPLPTTIGSGRTGN